MQRPIAVKPRKRVKTRTSQQASNPVMSTNTEITKEAVNRTTRSNGQALKAPPSGVQSTPKAREKASSKAIAQKAPPKPEKQTKAQPRESETATSNITERPRRVLTPRPIVRNDFAQSDYKPLHDFWGASEDGDGKSSKISFENPEIDIPEVKYVFPCTLLNSIG